MFIRFKNSDGQDFAINVEKIKSLVWNPYKKETHIYMSGEENPFIVKECFDEILQLISEASEGGNANDNS